MDNTVPLIIQPLDDVVVAENAADTTVDLFQHFDDPFTTGQVARFELFDSSLGGGVTNVVLFDQAGIGAPETVENFINYVEDGDYANSIIHRSIANFVVQGGGFTVDNSQVGSVPTDEPVVNEFNAERSNTRGTIAMAKLGNNPNSATSQWFFNLGDNSANLDDQNGGFTVFGKVISEEDLAPIDAIADLPTAANFGLSNIFGQLPFNDIPLILEDPANPNVEGDDNFVRYRNITVEQQDELTFSIVSNSNPDLVDVVIEDGQLSLDYAAGANGTAEIVIQATDLLGDSVEDTLQVLVEEQEENSDSDSDTDNLGETVYRFLNTQTGVHLYTTSEVERQSIIDNLPNYNFEGASYFSVDSLTGNSEPQRVYRFLNEITGAHFYTASEFERESVEANLSHFSLETSSYFAYTEQQPGTIPIYRFFNTQTGGHLYTPSATERDAVIDNLPNYDNEGIAFYAFPLAE